MVIGAGTDAVVQNYRGYYIEKFRGDGWIADLDGDEIFCDTLEQAYDTIDEYIGEEN